MDEIYDILSSKNKLRITKLVINNFTNSWDEELSIDMYIWTENYGDKKLHFSEVTYMEIDRDRYYNSEFTSIQIFGCTELQWERVDYHVTVLEDSMSFYCKSIHIESL